MEITSKAQLLEFIRQQGLRLLKENRAEASLEEKLADADEMYVQVNQKRLDKLNAEEERVMNSEDYSELQRIKQDKVTVLKKLIDSYKYKTKILEDIYNNLNGELQKLGVQGSGVFKNKQLTDFSNEEFQKGNTLKITTISSELKVEKVSENNQYKVLESNIPEQITPGDIIAIPNTKVGSEARISVYRDIGGRYEHIKSPTLKNITSITKNPS